jgi:type IV secretory pathway VirB4 component
MGNSESVFMGLVVVIFGYYGWLLYNIHSDIRTFYNKWERHRDYLDETREKVMGIEKEVTELEHIEARMNELNHGITEFKKDMLKEIEEETDDIKEVVKIVAGQFRYKNKNSNKGLKLCRDIRSKQGGNYYKRKKKQS